MLKTQDISKSFSGKTMIQWLFTFRSQDFSQLDRTVSASHQMRPVSCHIQLSLVWVLALCGLNICKKCIVMKKILIMVYCMIMLFDFEEITMITRN